MKPDHPRRHRPHRIVARFVAVSWRDLAMSIGPTVVLSIAAIWLAIALIQPAPPTSLTISAGPPGSTNWRAAQRYKQILAKNGVTLDVLESEGSAENLARLSDPAQKVDVGFVQSGIAQKEKQENLVSLGSVGYVPLAILYRGPKIQRLSQFKGKRLALGAEGAGAHELGIALLKMNGIAPGGATELLPLSGEDAARALIEGKIDAAFLSGDSTQIPVMAKLFRSPGVRFYSFTQAEAYTRRFPYLTDITLPMGVYDPGTNLPPSDIHTLSPTVELIARDTLHPALSDLLVEAAREVHGRATILQRAGEFPSPVTHSSFPLSDDAARYYKSGKTFLYRKLPFWVASLVDRLLFIVVPLIVVLIPGLRLVPSLYGWRVRSRIYRWYGALIALERSALGEHTARERVVLLDKLDDVEESVNRMKMPLAYAGQFYVLREHIGFVRERLLAREHESPPPAAANAQAAPKPADAPPAAPPASDGA
ncbi:TAXI family TRAP transporter solute-binding subunit [Burkholderia oklahomensis]|uniref:NMT1/THI5 like family protein n=1 Tax=Burkholderia oklahomensis TaxID=342113 RepID=A0AAI8B864_9BURK|nr:TAXI family TRAP transporter solute-binding subunit [Burkholderia oklahomensis]AIO67466.1 NMT1/THI5 like family protein [Burkholderia oklahomensis]AOI41472.1 C4-dicarboxylate ABC transporter substrate-binding protein [Burkholderia oklahomensis EO147]KUY63960.1 C4-dicarboxylate ABC transporter substrate-binding protein [Burkholderia oklahomensis EO147]MDN7671536.1 TAXI family TRAP transporter solute-binding subunit [Burkholderia oklahomensis]QPS36201.1 ABC transporter substrate-binding prote